MNEWKTTLEACLEDLAACAAVLTYQEVAFKVEVPGPGRIHRLTQALEDMIRQDISAGAPLRAAVVISRARDGLPGPGFFILCRELGLYFGPESGSQAHFFHDQQLQRLYQSRQGQLPNSR